MSQIIQQYNLGIQDIYRNYVPHWDISFCLFVLWGGGWGGGGGGGPGGKS